MNETQKILGVITARGGSKSIPKKNITPCAGKPLMYYTIKAAQAAKTITRLIITTDDEEIAGVARENGVEVPFMRPKEIAQDDSSDLQAFEHVLSALKEIDGYSPDILVHLRPTTPLKKASDIDKGVELLISHPDVDSVRSVCEPMHTPFKMYKIDDAGFLHPLLRDEFPDTYKKFIEPFNAERQLLPVVWRHSGYVDVIRRDVIERGMVSGENILPLFIEKWRDVDIDSPLEVAMAERIIEKLRAEGKEIWE